MPTTSSSHVVRVNGTQSVGPSTLTHRDVLSSPEDREFIRGLSAQQRQALDQLTPAQIQSFQQSGQWPAAKQAILAGRLPTQATQSGIISNPNRAATADARSRTPFPTHLGGPFSARPHGSRGFGSMVSFRTRGTPTTFRRDIATGNFEIAVGPNLLDLGAPTSASVLAVQEYGDSQLTIVQASSSECPIDYLVVDVSTAPYHNWHLGDCSTPLTFWSDDGQLFAEPANGDDTRTWVYSGGRMYGPMQRSAVFAGSQAPPPAPPPETSAATDDSTAQQDTSADEPAPSQSGDDAKQAPPKRIASAPPAKKVATATVTPPAPKHVPPTARFDPSCLGGAPPIEAQNTPCTYTPG